MAQNIAVAVIHGVGRQGSDFAEGLIDKVKDRFAELISGLGHNPDEMLVMEPVLWSPVLENEENELWRRLKREANLGYSDLRQFIISFAADAIAYQPIATGPKARTVYDAIHAKMAESMKRLAEKAGQKAPLCIVAHSLGTVIVCNYLYDLQKTEKSFMTGSLRSLTAATPLERGETLASFYTFGSPIAIWSLRYENFGTPIAVPSEKLGTHWPSIPATECQWINFYNRNDILAYPLKTLNDAYGKVVTEDRLVSVGGWLRSWNPFSHTEYWTDNDVTNPIAEGLARLWKAANA